MCFPNSPHPLCLQGSPGQPPWWFLPLAACFCLTAGAPVLGSIVFTKVTNLHQLHRPLLPRLRSHTCARSIFVSKKNQIIILLLKTFEWFSYGVDLTLELYVVLFLQSRKKNNQKHFADLSCEFQALPCCLVLTVRRCVLSLGVDSFESREQSCRWLPWPWFMSVTTFPHRE